MMKMNVGNLESQLRKLQKDRTEIDKAMANMPRSQGGTLNFSFFKAKKVREDLHQQAVRLSSMINPDNIA